MWLYCHFGALAALSACVGGFACGFCFVAVVAEDLEVVVAVVVGAALVVNVVNLQAFCVAALCALVTVTGEDAFAGGGGDVCAVVVLPHVASVLCALLRSWAGGLRPLGLFTSPSLDCCW